MAGSKRAETSHEAEYIAESKERSLRHERSAASKAADHSRERGSDPGTGGIQDADSAHRSPATDQPTVEERYLAAVRAVAMGEVNLEGGTLPRFALRNPHAAIVGGMIVALLGTVVFTQMPIDVFPQLNLKAAVVGTFFPGFAPIAIEQNITGRYERFFTLGAGIEHIERAQFPAAALSRSVSMRTLT
jgi:hypothetical protein